MPVLLLAQGEPAAKDLLRQAIEARYGMRPPALDSLKIDFKGRARVKLGPVNTWVPVELKSYFRFPVSMRTDFIVKPLKLPVQRGVEAFDGEVYRRVRGGDKPTIINDDALIHSMRRRSWAVASILLTPLSELFVNLTANSNFSFDATNTKLDDAATILLLQNHKLDQVKVRCVNPDTEKEQDYIINVSEELVTINELILPKKMTISWDDTPSFEVEPTNVESNPNFPDSVFRIEDIG